MTSLSSIVRFLNKGLDVKQIHDKSRNGLQVRVPKKINVIGFAVDASLETFERAKDLDVDLLIVHHGLFWKGQKDTYGLRLRRIAYLKKHRINLYAVHLPLDLHPTYGNNITLVHMLGVENIKPFGNYGGMNIGFCGRWKKSRTLKSIASILDHRLKTKSRVLQFGKNSIRSVAIVSGGAASLLGESVVKKFDCFITGEFGHSSYNDAKDSKQNVIISGHYATETVGVRSLIPVLKKRFGVKTIFIDLPTGM